MAVTAVAKNGRKRPIIHWEDDMDPTGMRRESVRAWTVFSLREHR